MSKVSVSDLPDQFVKDLKTSGLSYERMMQDYGLTRWGARKIGGHDAISSETAGNHEKIFVLEDEPGSSFLSLKVPVEQEEVNYEEERRQKQSSKQTITNKANTYLAELEREVKNSKVNGSSFEEPSFSDGGFTALIHETDPHFSAEVTDRSGEVIFNTEMARRGTDQAFDWYVERIRSKGVEFLDEIVLMLGGDLVEGENIYDGQAHQIDQTLESQISSARKCYFENLKRLRTEFDVPIKVVCASGNHSDMGTGSGANADDIIYSMLEDMVNLADMEDIKFVRSDRSNFVSFSFRNWRGYLTHGENRKHHVGTARPESDWLSIKDEFGFDVAFRGHYHNQKIENVNGAPIVMTNSRKPGDDYTDSLATFGVTGNAIYFATDDEVLEEVRVQTDV
jgi:hypothetical protein